VTDQIPADAITAAVQAAQDAEQRYARKRRPDGGSWRRVSDEQFARMLAAAAPVIAAAERDRCIRLAVERGAVYFAEPRPCTCKPGCAQVVSRVPFAPLLGGES
jgi:hypothetical protein